jgi:ABC-type phosphate transport system permease subunit
MVINMGCPSVMLGTYLLILSHSILSAFHQLFTGFWAIQSRLCQMPKAGVTGEKAGYLSMSFAVFGLRMMVVPVVASLI